MRYPPMRLVAAGPLRGRAQSLLRQRLRDLCAELDWLAARTSAEIRSPRPLARLLTAEAPAGAAAVLQLRTFDTPAELLVRLLRLPRETTALVGAFDLDAPGHDDAVRLSVDVGVTLAGVGSGTPVVAAVLRRRAAALIARHPSANFGAADPLSVLARFALVERRRSGERVAFRPTVRRAGNALGNLLALDWAFVEAWDLGASGRPRRLRANVSATIELDGTSYTERVDL